EHRHGVPDGRQIPFDLGPDPLCRRVGCDQVGERRLDRAQLALEEVVVGIGDLRIVVDVIALAVMPDLPAQIVGASRRIVPRAWRRLPPDRLFHEAPVQEAPGSAAGSTAVVAAAAWRRGSVRTKRAPFPTSLSTVI